MLWFFLSFILILGVIAVADYSKTRRLIRVGVAQAEQTVPFERQLSAAPQRILVIGDSSAVGVGAASPELSVAGYIGAEYPEAEVINKGVNGNKVADVLARIDELQGEKFDLVVVQIGGNDIVRFTKLNSLRRDLPLLLEKTKGLSDNVVLLTSGNVATSQLLPWGTRWLFAIRTKQVRALFMPINQQQGVVYVDLLRRKAQDPYAQDPAKYYSPDFFHPSGEGYADWYQFVSAAIKQTNFTP